MTVREASRMLTVNEAARALGVAPNTVRNMIAERTIRPTRYPGVRCVRISSTEIERLKRRSER